MVEPCYIEDGVIIENSTVGPNVAVEKGTVIRDSTVRDAIIGANCRIEASALHDAMLGDSVVIEGITGSVSVGSHSEVRGRRG